MTGTEEQNLGVAVLTGQELAATVLSDGLAPRQGPGSFGLQQRSHRKWESFSRSTIP